MHNKIKTEAQKLADNRPTNKTIIQRDVTSRLKKFNEYAQAASRLTAMQTALGDGATSDLGHALIAIEAMRARELWMGACPVKAPNIFFDIRPGNTQGKETAQALKDRLASIEADQNRRHDLLRNARQSIDELKRAVEAAASDAPGRK